MLILCAIYAIYTSLPQSDATLSCTKSVLFAFGGQYLQTVLRLLVSDLTSEIFNPYRRTTLLCWSLMLLNGAFMLAKGYVLINEFYLFNAINLITWLAIAHYVYHVLNELCSILNIRMFKIGAQNHDATAMTQQNDADKTKTKTQ